MTSNPSGTLTRRRQQVFAWSLGGLLVAPFMPVEFTSILTATVWSFSGGGYALAFLLFGTFLRLDSISVYAGVQEVLIKLFALPPGAASGYATIAVMFFGNVATAYLFRIIIRRKMGGRVPGFFLLPKGSLELGALKYSFAVLGHAGRGARRLEAALARVRLGAR